MKTVDGTEADIQTTCPACGTGLHQARPAWSFVNARGQTMWKQCHSCRSYFMDAPYDLSAEVSHTRTMTWGDAEQGARLNVFKQRMYRSVLGQLTARMNPRGRALLDVGCAYGGFLETASAAGFEVWGLDIVPEAIEYVTQRGLQAQCCGSVRDFRLREEGFDVISVLDANIYWPNQLAELQEVSRRLNPGGILVMRVVDKSWMASMGRWLQKLSPTRGEQFLRRAVNDHRFSMPVSSLLSVLGQCGFDVIQATPRGAIHSDDTSLAVKLSFTLGIAVWETLGWFFAPGAVVVAEKNSVTC